MLVFLQKNHFAGTGLYNIRYAVGIVNKRTGEIELHEATSITVDNVVKALKTSESKTIGDKNMEARNQLGQAFGTKKRKQAIKAYEMNQINVGGLAEVANKINDTISEHVAKLPEKQSAEELSMADRVIPPCNLSVISQFTLGDYTRRSL